MQKYYILTANQHFMQKKTTFKEEVAPPPSSIRESTMDLGFTYKLYKKYLFLRFFKKFFKKLLYLYLMSLYLKPIDNIFQEIFDSF